jgi:glycerophosphoryl diester phosphodiesterase
MIRRDRRNRRIHPYLAIHTEGGFAAFAHRGGTSAVPDGPPENTLASFRHAVQLGYRYLETDVHATADGRLAAFHDPDLQRTCGRPGLISDLTSAELSEVRVDGSEPIPMMEDLFEEFPEARFNIDAKSDEAVEPLIDLLRRTATLDRVCIGSFSHRRLQRIRSAFGDYVCTSASPREVASWMGGGAPVGPDCLQVPESQGRLPVVTERSIARARSAGLPVHVWTIDDAASMQKLIDLGVDGIMTDHGPRLREVARANGRW